MPQQINLCTPGLQKPTQHFTANTMAQALAVFVVLGGVLCAAWAWNLQRASSGLDAALQAQTLEIQNLQAAIERSKAMAQPPSPALVKNAQDRRAELEAKELVLRDLQQGALVAGAGHSDRLALVAQSIPAPVWVTEIKADAGRLEVSGFTLEPSALNAWVSRLGASPLLQGLRLATVKVQSVVVPVTPATPAAPAAAVAGVAAATAGREAWSFNLVNAQTTPPPNAVPGAKP